MATEKKPRATKVLKKVEEVTDSPDIVKEAPKKGRKKVEPIIEEIIPPIPADIVIEETSTSQRKGTRNTKKGGKKYIKRTKKYKKRKLTNSKKRKLTNSKKINKNKK